MSEEPIKYCPYYCEENVWHLIGHPRFDGIETRVVVISNASRSCALWGQRAAPSYLEPIVWDYHVILISRKPTGWLVWDLDTTLGIPSTFDDYLEGTFLPLRDELSSLVPRFRVVEAGQYRAHFSSDRSHMRDGNKGWLQAPPCWPAIHNPDAGSFLRWTEMKDDDDDVLSIEQLVMHFGTP